MPSLILLSILCLMIQAADADVLIKETQLNAKDIAIGGEKLQMGAGTYCVDGVLMFEKIKMRIEKLGDSKIRIMRPNDSLDPSLNVNSTMLTCKEPIVLKLVQGAGVKFLDSKISEKFNQMSCNGRQYTASEMGRILGQRIEIPQADAPECAPPGELKDKKAPDLKKLSR